jgi:hypothetical protein
MLRQEELAFIKFLSTSDFSRDLLKELREALATRAKKKKLKVSVRIRSTSSGGSAIASQRSSGQLAGKRKTKELGSSVESSEPAVRPLPANPTEATGKIAANGSQQLGSSENRMSYMAVLAATLAPQNTSKPLTPIVEGCNQSIAVTSTERPPRRMSTDMSGQMSGMPVGTTTSAQLANIDVPAGQRRNKKRISITGVTETRAFPFWLRASFPSVLTAQLKHRKFMVVP